MIIDAHLHVFLSVPEDPERVADPLASAERRAPVEMLEGEMAVAGVDGAVLVPLGGEERYVAEVVASDPTRFAGIAVARPGEHDPGVVAERLDRGGFSGLRMFDLPGSWDDAPWRPVLERMARDGRILWMYPRAEDLGNLALVAERLEGLRVVLNHSGLTQAGIGVDDQGRPRLISPIPQPTEPAVLSLAAHDNVAVVLSGAYGFSHEPYPYRDIAAISQRLLGAYGADRLMWASDFPWIVDDPGYGACLALVDEHLPGLSADERGAILGGTCQQLFSWKER